MTGFQQNDIAAELRERVLTAKSASVPLVIAGGGSKRFYGYPMNGQKLDVKPHRGIINYEPTELVLTARCGTPLSEIEHVLRERRQMLAFEPPYFGDNATLGGMVACGLSGARRPYAGAVRDAILGVKMLNGQGEIVRFGGEVMKNVAGFDLSRLQAGALGTLGVLLEVSLKVLPIPESEMTLLFTADIQKALEQMTLLGRQNLPISGLCHDGEFLRVRLSGSVDALSATVKRLGGEVMADNEASAFWISLREQTHIFFGDNQPLWRLSLPPATPQPVLDGRWLIDWGGALRWLKSDHAPETIFDKVHTLGGHACRFRSSEGCLFQPLPEALLKLHRNLKYAFDPHGLFNKGRLNPEW